MAIYVDYNFIDCYRLIQSVILTYKSGGCRYMILGMFHLDIQKPRILIVSSHAPKESQKLYLYVQRLNLYNEVDTAISATSYSHQGIKSNSLEITDAATTQNPCKRAFAFIPHDRSINRLTNELESEDFCQIGSPAPNNREGRAR